MAAAATAVDGVAAFAARHAQREEPLLPYERACHELLSDEPVLSGLALALLGLDELAPDELVPDKPVPVLFDDEPLPDEPVPDEPVPDEPVPDEPVPDEPLPDELAPAPSWPALMPRPQTGHWPKPDWVASLSAASSWVLGEALLGSPV
nr:hypothetical protein [Frankia sp. Cj3]